MCNASPEFCGGYFDGAVEGLIEDSKMLYAMHDSTIIVQPNLSQILTTDTLTP